MACPRCLLGLGFDATTAGTEAPTEEAPLGAGPRVERDRFLPGQVLLGRYRIVAPLGRGGMGEVVIQDSAKRPTPARSVFVLQARPRWSARHWDDERDDWTAALLQAAVPSCGERVARPDWRDVQRWRYARLAGGETLTMPTLVRLDNGCRVGVAGEATMPDGGVQGAWLAGRRIARRLLGEEGP